MKKQWKTPPILPVAAVLAGVILLICVFLSYRFLLAAIGLGLIGWGAAQCWC